MDENHEAPSTASVTVPAIGYFVPIGPSSTAESPVRFREILESLVAGRNIIMLATLLSAGVALGVAFWLSPYYRSEVLLAPAIPDGDRVSSGHNIAGQFGSLVTLAGISTSSSIDPKYTAIATLQSRALVERFISENGLMPALFPDRWDSEHNSWIGSDHEQIPSAGMAYELFSSKILRVAEDKKTGLVTVSIEWTDREKAAEWANGIVGLTNAYLRNKAIDKAEKNIAYLKEQSLKTTVVELQEAIYRLMEAEIKKSMLASVGEQFAFVVIDPAVPGIRKVRPRRLLILLSGLMAGILVGWIVAYQKYNGLSKK